MAADGGRGALTGHMVAAERALRANLAAVDVVWEVADARCPRASRNPRLRRLCAGKPVVLVLTKADLAEEEATGRWLAALRPEQPALAVDLGLPVVPGGLWSATRAALQRAGRGGPGREGYRAMVVGAPNTGKSTLLNRVSGGRHAAVGAAPGVTRGPQWLRLPEGGGRVLDLPGVLAPRLAGWPVIWRLWAIGALGARAVDEERAGAALVEWICARSPRALEARYGIDERAGGDGPGVLAAIARRRGLLGLGGVPDGHRAASVLLSDFRRGQLGALTLEEPVAPEGDGRPGQGDPGEA